MLKFRILVLSIILFMTACLKSYREPPEVQFEKKVQVEKVGFCTFPPSLKNAIEQKLNMKCTDVTSNHLSQIKQLTIKNISAEEVNLLDKKYASYFISLEDVDISDNPYMKILPEFLMYIPNLKKLNVSSTGIKNFPGEMCNLENSLTTLIAANNNYEGQEIPIAVFCLSKLKVLNMSNSSLRYIDEYIGQLSHLEELYVSKNSLFLIPQMLSTLPHLTLVDFRDNTLKNEDLNSFQSCKSLKGEKKKECQEDLLDSIECEAVHELPFQRGEPLRQIYTSLAGQSQELMKQCENDNGQQYCPPFIMKCRDYPEYDKEQCMLDTFESTKAGDKHKFHRDKCYITWVTWLIDYEKSPALLNKTIRGKTIREMRYVGKNQSVFTCWELPWENIRILGGWIDFAPKKYSANPIEVFPEEFREPGTASHVKAFVSFDSFWWVPEDCLHLSPNLKELIKRIVEEHDQKYTETQPNNKGGQ